MRYHRTRLGVAAAFLLLGATGTANQVGSASRAATQVVSPAVVATWLTKPNGAELELLVLWRGTPGWFLESRQTTSATVGSDTFKASASFAGTTLQVEFSRRSRLATLNGVAVTLGDHNVVLVDDVDAGKRMTIAGLTTIRDPMVNESVASVIAKGPGTVAYLRCDVRLPQESARRLMEHLCAPYR